MNVLLNLFFVLVLKMGAEGVAIATVISNILSSGRPSAERVWVECFAQLVGTVLSLWDAAALDAAGEDGEVVPTFINLSDASLKMVSPLLRDE